MAGRLLFVILMYSCGEIQVEAGLPPTLIVNPPVITETDSVTLECRAPSSVSVSQCYFYVVGRESPTILSCMKTLTGSELLIKARQKSPAEVKVKCFYTIKQGRANSPSPHSYSSSITIHSPKPQMSVQHFDDDYILFTCTLPGPADHDTRCNLYIGEATRPILTDRIWKTMTPTNQRFCQFTVTVDDLLRRLRSVQQSDASCDYTLGSDPNPLSPRSDRYSLTDIVKRESSMASTRAPFTATKGVTAAGPSYTGSFISASLTPVRPTSGQTRPKPGTNANSFPVTPPNPTSETWTWKLVVAAACFGGVVFLGLALLCAKRRTGNCLCLSPGANGSSKSKFACGYMKSLNSGEYLPSGYDETYSIVSYEFSNTE